MISGRSPELREFEAKPDMSRVKQATARIVLIGAVSITSAAAQESFYLYERNALAGNYTAQRNAAYCLKTAKCEGVIFPRMIEACSWRIVILGSGHHWVNETDIENYQDECVSSLSAQEQGSALARAEQLFKRIYKRPLPQLDR
jgi:alanine dehydrogenase